MNKEETKEERKKLIHLTFVFYRQLRKVWLSKNEPVPDLLGPKLTERMMCRVSAVAVIYKAYAERTEAIKINQCRVKRV